MTTLNLPDEIIISNVQVTHNMPSFNTESLSLKTNSRDRGLHRLEGSFDVTIQDLNSQKSLTAFLLKLRGRANKFYLDLPLHFKSELTINPTLSTAKGIGSTSITLFGVTDKIYAGSCFTLPNDSKIYHIVDSIDRDGSVEIYPALMQKQLVNSVVEFTDPQITCRLDDELPTIDYSENGVIVETSINFIEAM